MEPVKLEGKRGSGRTHRMLENAVATARAQEGGTVLVVGIDGDHAKEMMNTTWGLTDVKSAAASNWAKLNPGNMEISFWPKGQIRFIGADSPQWDKRAGRIVGYPVGTPLYVDHAV